MDTAPSGQDLKAILETTLQPFVQHVVASFGLAGREIAPAAQMNGDYDEMAA